MIGVRLTQCASLKVAVRVELQYSRTVAVCMVLLDVITLSPSLNHTPHPTSTLPTLFSKGSAGLASHHSVYFANPCDGLQVCYKRNTHQRSLRDIQAMSLIFEEVPSTYTVCDASSLFRPAGGSHAVGSFIAGEAVWGLSCWCFVVGSTLHTQFKGLGCHWFQCQKLLYN
jgi:hypothetical protein